MQYHKLLTSFLLLIPSLSYFILYRPPKPSFSFIIAFNNEIPVILLYTHNRSKKTEMNICRGIRNAGRLVNFDKCPSKCRFSCRLEDLHHSSTRVVLFFGEDFYWPFKISDKNRSSTKQRWVFWSWESYAHHPEYSKSGLTFNWFALLFDSEKNDIR